MLQVGRRLCRRIACCAIGALVLLAPLAASAVPFGDNGIAIPPIYIPGATSPPTALVRQAGGVREIVFADPDPGSRASSVAVDSAGRTVVLASPVNPTTSQGIGVARLTPQGLLDTSFNGTGLSKFGTYGTQAGSIAVDAANNVFITGLDDPSSSTPVFV